MIFVQDVPACTCRSRQHPSHLLKSRILFQVVQDRERTGSASQFFGWVIPDLKGPLGLVKKSHLTYKAIVINRLVSFKKLMEEPLGIS